eukprot:gene6556-6784_t
MAHRLLQDPDADGWERSDFPIVCETCLGPNPYVRMQRIEFGGTCHISGRPYTVFRWRPGNDARYKKTIICQEVAKAKNVCQVCLFDLDYGLPVQVRDTALGIEKEDIPESDVGKEFQLNEQIQKGQMESSFGSSRPSDMLLQLQRTTPYYKRNQARICSFFVKGQCNRGAECPYRHEMPEQNELSEQNIKDRYYGINDPVANKLLRRFGDQPKLEPPEDKTITSLYIGGVTPEISEEDLRDVFYTYGELAGVRKVASRFCAFVTYTERGAAEKAAEALHNKLIVKNVRLRLMASGQEAAARTRLPSGNVQQMQRHLAVDMVLPTCPHHDSTQQQLACHLLKGATKLPALQPAQWMSSSYLSLEANLEGAILHHTEAVDHYLETAASKWSSTVSHYHASPEQLRMLFVADMASSFWQSTALGMVAESQLELYLRQDVQRYMDMCSQPGAEASSIVAQTDLHAHNEAGNRTDSNTHLLVATGPSTGQSVCPPQQSAAAAVTAVEPVVVSTEASVEVPANAHLAAVAADQVLGDGRWPRASSDKAALTAAPNSLMSATKQVTASSSSGSRAESVPVSAAAQSDEDLAAQKQAARLQLAELQQAAAAATSTSRDAAPSPGEKAPSVSLSKAAAGSTAHAGSSSLVTSRLQAVAGLQQVDAPQPGTAAGASYAAGCLSGYGQEALLQQYRVFQALLIGLLCCLAVLGASWGCQVASLDISRLSIPWHLRKGVQAAAPVMYMLCAAFVLLYLFSRVVVLQPAVLHFPDRQLEHQYLLWSNSGKLSLDCMFQMLLLMAVHPAGDGLPSALSMPIVVLAQLISIACMPMRLATFIPCQVLQLLVLLWKVQPPHSALQVALLLGGGLFGPCLMLYCMELYSRKAFMVTVVHSTGKKNV